jgi:hypothetical protein
MRGHFTTMRGRGRPRLSLVLVAAWLVLVLAAVCGAARPGSVGEGNKNPRRGTTKAAPPMSSKEAHGQQQTAPTTGSSTLGGWGVLGSAPLWAGRGSGGPAGNKRPLRVALVSPPDPSAVGPLKALAGALLGRGHAVSLVLPDGGQRPWPLGKGEATASAASAPALLPSAPTAADRAPASW